MRTTCPSTSAGTRGWPSRRRGNASNTTTRARSTTQQWGGALRAAPRDAYRLDRLPGDRCTRRCRGVFGSGFVDQARRARPAKVSWTLQRPPIEYAHGFGGHRQALYRRRDLVARARRPLFAARALRGRPASRRPRLQARQPHRLLSYRAHDPALHRRHDPPKPLLPALSRADLRARLRAARSFDRPETRLPARYLAPDGGRREGGHHSSPRLPRPAPVLAPRPRPRPERAEGLAGPPVRPQAWRRCGGAAFLEGLR